MKRRAQRAGMNPTTRAAAYPFYSIQTAINKAEKDARAIFRLV